MREINGTRDELNQKISEIGRLRIELQRREIGETDNTVENLKNVIATLEDENRNIKVLALPCLLKHSLEKVFCVFYLCSSSIVLAYMFLFI